MVKRSCLFLFRSKCRCYSGKRRSNGSAHFLKHMAFNGTKNFEGKRNDRYAREKRNKVEQKIIKLFRLLKYLNIQRNVIVLKFKKRRKLVN
ncbi:insulinase family protein [Flavobacterium sp. W22_SRS_FK3]|uniref:insulinase family protein n=1 Tax=Flavobacterium sp. W22_SRS_FK3 TaxID=3240275 RepID=UPI003F8F35A3